MSTQQRKEIKLEDFESLSEAILMRRLERLSYYSSTFNIRCEQEMLDMVGRPGQRRFVFIVEDVRKDKIVEMAVGDHDNLEAEFESLKTKWILNYDNI